MTSVSSATTSASDVSSYFQDVIQARQKRQADRIAQGVASGALTESEADRLGKLESRIDKLAQKVTSDGTVSADEFARIMHAQDKASHRIYGLKHNSHGATGAQGAQGLDALLSNAQMSGAVSNASAQGGAVFADMNKLFQDIANFRQTLQNDRIQLGVDSGQLTPEEQQKLKTLQTSASDTFDQAMSDGSMSAKDFVNVMQAQSQVSRQIFHYRHNQRMFDPTQAGGDPSQAGANQQPVSVTV